MNDLEIKRITLDMIFVKSKLAQQSIHYSGLWEELLLANASKMKEEVSNDKLDSKRC